MNLGLVKYSIERMSSLQDFYKSVQKTVIAKAKKGIKKNRFGYLVDRYFLILMLGAEEEQQKESFVSLKKYVEKYVDILDFQKNSDANNSEGKILYRLKNTQELEKKGYELNIQKATEEYRKSADIPTIHGANTLVMLITRFEEFISNVLSELYVSYPQKYLNNQKIEFSEILNVGIDEVKDKIISREIDKKMRESYSEWFKLFADHGMKLDSCQDELKKLKEVYCRRNIIVHNSGQVNATYIKEVPNSNVKIGDFLFPDEAYLSDAFASIKIIMFSILIEAVRLIETQKSSYLYGIFEVAFEELVNEHYYVCHKVFSEIAENKHSDAQTKMLSKVNCWIAQKALNGLDSIKGEIEEFDFSALDEMYTLARAVLLNHYDEVNRMLSGLLDTKKLPPSYIEEWPLFKEYRKTSQYEQFKTHHPEVFEISSVEIGQNNFDSSTPSGHGLRSEINAMQQANDDNLAAE